MVCSTDANASHGVQHHKTRQSSRESRFPADGIRCDGCSRSSTVGTPRPRIDERISCFKVHLYQGNRDQERNSPLIANRTENKRYWKSENLLLGFSLDKANPSRAFEKNRNCLPFSLCFTVEKAIQEDKKLTIHRFQEGDRLTKTGYTQKVPPMLI
jgi:hypothetical protein